MINILINKSVFGKGVFMKKQKIQRKTRTNPSVILLHNITKNCLCVFR